MGNLFRSGSGLFIPGIAQVGWLRSLLWRWDAGSRGDISMAERLQRGQVA
ncbi:MAG: hypothetical protein HQL71_07630 [Magnetococcales bacterium]|nr:hypothetical protein [Magnetococcales bacterium]